MGMMNIYGNLQIREFIIMKPLIKDIRQSKGITQKFVSEKAKISQQQLSDFENGKALPRIDKAFRIAKVLGVSVYDLWIYEE